MVADDLALGLVQRYVPAKSSVLDPFCGSGRMLAAADRAALRVGVDTNPLAWLLTKAKLSHARPEIIADVVADLAHVRRRGGKGPSLREFERRQVEWFAPEVLRELGRIVAWVNKLQLAEPELCLVAAALSATAREVSYARQDGWKLHRLTGEQRAGFRPSPWHKLESRLRYCVDELNGAGPLLGERLVIMGSVSSLSTAEWRAQYGGLFDVVLTSPPYGDSRSTVQYGAASALCMGVIRHIKGLAHLGAAGGEIDARCLGGVHAATLSRIEIKPYWAGSRDGKFAKAVHRFLSDYDEACEAIARCVRPGGTAILVVGRRSTGGFRLRLDDFTVDRFRTLGFELACRESRSLLQKRIPRRINRFGRSNIPGIREHGIVVTMTNEIILVLRKRQSRFRTDGDQPRAFE
jgi:site-specific DNA-methyltransferase (cytosine-N4-specific)